MTTQSMEQTKNIRPMDSIKKKRHYGLIFWLWFSDIFLMIGTYCFAYAIRFAPGMPVPVFHGIPPFTKYLHILPFSVLVYFLTLRFYGLYRLGRFLSTFDEFFLIIKSIFVGSIILMASSFVYRDYTYSRIMLVITAILLAFVLFLNRLLFHFIEAKLGKLHGFQKNILLVGHGPAIRQLIHGFSKQKKGGGAVVIGIVTNNKDHVGSHINGTPVIGVLDDFEQVLEKFPADEVILGELDVSRTRILEMVLKCEEVMASFKMVPDLLGSMTNKLDIENVNGVSLLGIKETPLNHPVNRFIKRATDMLMSALALAIFSPIMLFVAAVVKFSDGGPVLYKQSRVGEDGRVFKIYKFRSMKVDAESSTGPKFADEDDSRKTHFGDFLRRSNLDELPQLFNVLKGNMSLVGPRPERPFFVDQLKVDIPRYMSRHRVRSGITGWAQVNGLRGGQPSEERIKYDLYYIENWSIWFDFKILFMTLFAFKNAW